MKAEVLDRCHVGEPAPLPRKEGRVTHQLDTQPRGGQVIAITDRRTSPPQEPEAPHDAFPHLVAQLSGTRLCTLVEATERGPAFVPRLPNILRPIRQQLFSHLREPGCLPLELGDL